MKVLNGIGVAFLGVLGVLYAMGLMEGPFWSVHRMVGAALLPMIALVASLLFVQVTGLLED